MSYCCSFYGNQLWDLSSTWFDAICVAWNKAVRRIFQLPHNTHRFLLPYVVDGNPIRDQLSKRCVKFYESCDESKNSIIQLLVYNANFENTPMGINMRYIAMHSKSKVKIDSEKHGSGHLLHSLLKIREQYWEISEFTRAEVECMIYNVCIIADFISYILSDVYSGYYGGNSHACVCVRVFACVCVYVRVCARAQALLHV